MKIWIDSKEQAFDTSACETLAEVIELVRASLSPAEIVTSVFIDRRRLDEADLEKPASLLSHSKLEIVTENKHSYIVKQLTSANSYLEQISAEFMEAEQSFRSDKSEEGNEALSSAVDNFLTFNHWYVSVLSFDADKLAKELVEFAKFIDKIHQLCEKVLEEQLDDGEIIIAEMIAAELLPQIRELKEWSVAVAARYQ